MRRSTPWSIGVMLVTSACGLYALPAQAEKLRMGMIGTVSDVTVYLAERKGYFKQEGIELEITQFNTAARMVAPLGNGQLDLGGGAISAGLFNANARGIGIMVVADKGSNDIGYNFGPLLIRKDHVDSGRFKSLADLKGMKIAVAAPGTTNAATLWQALVKGGLKWSDANVVGLGFPQHVVAFGNKGIDAGMTVEPLATLAIKKGVAVKYVGSDEIYPDHQTAAILYTTAFVKARPQLAHGFMKAYIKGVRDYNDALKDGHIAGRGADEVIATIIGYSKAKSTDLLREITPHACDPNGRIRIGSIAKDLEFFKEQKLINKEGMTARDIVDDSFAKRVVKELGPYKPRKS